MRGMTSATIAWALAASVATGVVTIGGRAWAHEAIPPDEGVSRVHRLDVDASSNRIRSQPSRTGGSKDVYSLPEKDDEVLAVGKRRSGASTSPKGVTVK